MDPRDTTSTYPIVKVVDAFWVWMVGTTDGMTKELEHLGSYWEHGKPTDLLRIFSNKHSLEFKKSL